MVKKWGFSPLIINGCELPLWFSSTSHTHTHATPANESVRISLHWCLSPFRIVVVVAMFFRRKTFGSSCSPPSGSSRASSYGFRFTFALCRAIQLSPVQIQTNDAPNGLETWTGNFFQLLPFLLLNANKWEKNFTLNANVLNTFIWEYFSFSNFCCCYFSAEIRSHVSHGINLRWIYSVPEHYSQFMHNGADITEGTFN